MVEKAQKLAVGHGRPWLTVRHGGLVLQALTYPPMGRGFWLQVDQDSK